MLWIIGVQIVVEDVGLCTSGVGKVDAGDRQAWLEEAATGPDWLGTQPHVTEVVLRCRARSGSWKARHFETSVSFQIRKRAGVVVPLRVPILDQPLELLLGPEVGSGVPLSRSGALGARHHALVIAPAAHPLGVRVPDEPAARVDEPAARQDRLELLLLRLDIAVDGVDLQLHAWRRARRLASGL